MLTGKRRVVGRRGGLTLVELMATVAVAGVVLAIIAGVALRQQRTFAALSADAALAGQLRDAASVLPSDLRSAAVGADDLREATDTSIEIRETLASAVVCDTLAHAVVLAPFAGTAATFAGAMAPIQGGDTAWIFSTDDSSHPWRGHAVLAAGSTHAGQCIAGGPRIDAALLAAPRTTLTLDSVPAPQMLVGRPVRVTRPIRYSLYRASDANWYLGARDWNDASARFNTIQPLAGPFRSPGSGPVFRWFDSTGAALASPVSRRDHVAFVRIDLRGQTHSADRVLGSASNGGPRADSVSISVAVRNRP
jgi:prepilin-type N-terminal cleavage/methylation domain-containing protein